MMTKQVSGTALLQPPNRIVCPDSATTTFHHVIVPLCHSESIYFTYQNLCSVVQVRGLMDIIRETWVASTFCIGPDTTSTTSPLPKQGVLLQCTPFQLELEIGDQTAPSVHGPKKHERSHS